MAEEEDKKDKSYGDKSYTQSLANFLIIAESSMKIISYLYRMYVVWNDDKSSNLRYNNYNFHDDYATVEEPAAENESEEQSDFRDRIADDEETEDPNNQCKICLTNVIRTINFTCMHRVFCFECAVDFLNANGERTGTCPICRIPIKQIKQTF